MIFQTFDDILGSAVNSKISEISDILAKLNTSSTEYGLLTSVKDMLGNISLLETSSRRARRAASEITKYFLRIVFRLLSGCETELEKWTTLRKQFQNIRVVLNKMNNTSIQAVQTSVLSLKNFVKEKLILIEQEIRYF